MNENVPRARPQRGEVGGGHRNGRAEVNNRTVAQPRFAPRGELRRRLLGLLVLAGMTVTLPVAALAQDEVKEEEFNPDPPVSDTEKLGNGSVEQDLDLYWGGRRDVQVVEGMLHDKSGRFELGVFGGLIPNDPFLTYVPFGARLDYHFANSVAVELGGSWAGVAFDSELTTFLKTNREVDLDTDLRDIQQWRANAALIWSPLYGKLALLQRKLSHFDLYLAAGFGVVSTQIPNAERDGTTAEVKPEGIGGFGVRVFVNDWFSVRADYRQGFFAEGDEDGGVAVPVELTLGLSFLLGGDK